jgi:hypothetical protein
MELVIMDNSSTAPFKIQAAWFKRNMKIVCIEDTQRKIKVEANGIK